MSACPVLESLRIGCVQYLNALPLIYGYTGPVTYDHPSALAKQLARGDLDAGLVPIYEALGARHYLLVDGVSIACDGPVYSVFLAHRKTLQKTASIAMDPGSLTSVHLLKVLLAEFHGIAPVYVGLEEAPEADAMLLIGNQAIEFRRAHPDDYQFLDLGQEWKRCTRLPFVFAVWMLRPGLPDPKRLGDGFRALKSEGCQNVESIVASSSFQDSDFRFQYLTRYIRYGLGAPEKSGIEKYRSLLLKHGLLPGNAEPLEFV